MVEALIEREHGLRRPIFSCDSRDLLFDFVECDLDALARKRVVHGEIAAAAPAGAFVFIGAAERFVAELVFRPEVLGARDGRVRQNGQAEAIWELANP